MKAAACSIVAIFLLAFTTSAQAITLTMVSSPNDLSNLFVGDVVQIDVMLEFQPSQTPLELASLGATIEIPALFSDPFNEVAGPIVPVATDLTLTPLAGLIDGQFFAFDGGNITDEGVFFSFEITAAATGSGVIAFDLQSLFAEDEQFNVISDFVVNELPFTIGERATGSPIPEPATGLLGLVGLAALVARRRHAH